MVLGSIIQRFVVWCRETVARCGLGIGTQADSTNATYESPYILSLNGQDLARLSGMYIPDQFWKHYSVEILTSDAELKHRMLEDESFWLKEIFVLTREADGAQHKLNDGESYILIGINQARRLREDSEISLRGI